jgi:hypothetical protein
MRLPFVLPIVQSEMRVFRVNVRATAVPVSVTFILPDGRYACACAPYIASGIPCPCYLASLQEMAHGSEIVSTGVSLFSHFAPRLVIRDFNEIDARWELFAERAPFCVRASELNQDEIIVFSSSYEAYVYLLHLLLLVLFF